MFQILSFVRGGARAQTDLKRKPSGLYHCDSQRITIHTVHHVQRGQEVVASLKKKKVNDKWCCQLHDQKCLTRSRKTLHAHLSRSPNVISRWSSIPQHHSNRPIPLELVNFGTLELHIIFGTKLYEENDRATHTGALIIHWNLRKAF